MTRAPRRKPQPGRRTREHRMALWEWFDQYTKDLSWEDFTALVPADLDPTTMDGMVEFFMGLPDENRRFIGESP